MFSLNYEISETLMLICFGSSWPFSIYRSLRSKSAAGKSIVFLSLILAGYAFGIAYKLMKQPDAVTWLYVINSAMILTEIILYFRYRKPSNRAPDTHVLENFCPSTCLRS